jgi:hypothetical protein
MKTPLTTHFDEQPIDIGTLRILEAYRQKDIHHSYRQIIQKY